MFSKYKKTNGAAAPKQIPTAAKVAQPSPTAAPAEPEAPAKAAPVAMRRKVTAVPAAAGNADKERKRKERMGEIKIEMHRSLLDNLNLAALEHASEKELRAEIGAIAGELLD